MYEKNIYTVRFPPLLYFLDLSGGSDERPAIDERVWVTNKLAEATVALEMLAKSSKNNDSVWVLTVFRTCVDLREQ